MGKCENCANCYHGSVCDRTSRQIYANIAEGGICRDFIAEDLVVEALEKQIPKKPKLYENGYDSDGKIIYDAYDCPNCSMSYDFNYDNYSICPSCGQILDWSETE